MTTVACCGLAHISNAVFEKDLGIPEMECALRGSELSVPEMEVRGRGAVRQTPSRVEGRTRGVLSRSRSAGLVTSRVGQRFARQRVLIRNSRDDSAAILGMSLRLDLSCAPRKNKLR